MTGAQIEITGENEALAAFSAVIARMDNPQPLFDRIGASLVVSTQKRFESETDPDGSPWPQSVRAKLEGGKTLSDTRHLFKSITHVAANDGVEIGTNLIHAAVHQHGATIKAKTTKGLRFRGAGNGGWVTKQEVTIPQRAFLGLDAADEAEITELAGDYIEEPFGGRNAD